MNSEEKNCYIMIYGDLEENAIKVISDMTGMSLEDLKYLNNILPQIVKTIISKI